MKPCVVYGTEKRKCGVKPERFLRRNTVFPNIKDFPAHFHTETGPPTEQLEIQAQFVFCSSTRSDKLLVTKMQTDSFSFTTVFCFRFASYRRFKLYASILQWAMRRAKCKNVGVFGNFCVCRLIQLHEKSKSWGWKYWCGLLGRPISYTVCMAV